MGLFKEFREPGWNTYYSDRPTPVEVDVTTTVVIYLSVVLAAAVVMIVFGTRGHQRWTKFLRLLFCLHTGVIIIVCNVSQSWQVAHVQSHCQYSLEVAEDMYGDVSLYIGLKTINITLRGTENAVHSSGRISYNEEFSFDRVQDIKNSYRVALERGLPLPIIYTLEFFNVDDGGFIWQRAIRSAGHFTYIIFWSSLVSWFVANVLLCSELMRGLAVWTLTGCLMVSGAIVYHAMQPTRPLVIRFEDGLLIPYYGWSFWLAFAAGILASLFGVSLLVLYSRYPAATSRLLMIDDARREETSRERYDYSPGPLRIDTPFSRRLACRRSDKTSKLGLPNNAFLLDDLPSSSRGQCRASDTENDAVASDHHDDGQSATNSRSSSYVALSRTNSSKCRTTGDCDRPTYNTTRVVIERSTSTCDFDDDKQLVSNEYTLQQYSTSPASVELSSTELTSTT